MHATSRRYLGTVRTSFIDAITYEHSCYKLTYLNLITPCMQHHAVTLVQCVPRSSTPLPTSIVVTNSRDGTQGTLPASSCSIHCDSDRTQPVPQQTAQSQCSQRC